MFLFYLNRYLRLSIPYALAIGVYVGVIPLLLAGGPIASSNLAFVEVQSRVAKLVARKLIFDWL